MHISQFPHFLTEFENFLLSCYNFPMIRIAGFQKLTLLDYPGHLAATIFLSGCNFRCPFCHNSDLFDPESLLSVEEVINALRKRIGVLEGVCITGGEPTLQAGLPDLIRTLKELGYAVKLDTNGYRPAVLKDLCNSGLVDYVAMDIKASPQKYGEAAGLPAIMLPLIEESAAFLKTGCVPYEFRTTAMPELHNEQDFLAIGKWLKGPSPYYLQAYQESDQVYEKRFTAPSPEWMSRMRDILLPWLPAAKIRGL